MLYLDNVYSNLAVVYLIKGYFNRNFKRRTSLICGTKHPLTRKFDEKWSKFDEQRVYTGSTYPITRENA